MLNAIFLILAIHHQKQKFMKTSSSLLLLAFFAGIHLQLFAGWEIVYRNESADGHIEYDVLLIEDQKFKYTQGDGGFIYNATTKRFTWYFDDLNGYWQGELSQFKSEMFAAMKAVTDELLVDFAEDQRAMYASFFDQMALAYQAPDQQDIDTLKLTTEETGNKEEFAGFEGREHYIKVDDEIVEKIWIATSLDVTNDLDPVNMTEVFAELTVDIDQAFLFVHHKDYKALWRKGFVMKTVDKYGDTMEVIKVEQRSVTPEEFLVPEGFVPVTAREIITSQMMESNDDGYND
jgi:hypothetical protein